MSKIESFKSFTNLKTDLETLIEAIYLQSDEELTIDWHWQVTTMDVGVDLVDRGLDLVVDIHPVITLNYKSLDSIWSPGPT